MSFVFSCDEDHRDFNLSIRRQRQRGIRDSAATAVMQAARADLRHAAVLLPQPNSSRSSTGKTGVGGEESVGGPCTAAAGGLHVGSGTDTDWHQVTPVFAALTAWQAASMLEEVAAAHSREVALKRAVLDVLTRNTGTLAAAAAPPNAKPVVADGGGGAAARMAGDQLRSESAAAIAVWQCQPLLDNDRVVLLLRLLDDDMAGF